MSDVDPTPDTPITLGDRMAWWRGDLAARMVTLEAQVAALRGTPASDLAALQAQVAALRGTPASDLAALQAQVAALAGTPASDLAAIQSQLAEIKAQWDHGLGYTAYNMLDMIYLQYANSWGHGSGYTPYNMLDMIYMQLVELNTGVDALKEGIGASPYESLELGSVRGLLNALLTNGVASTYGLMPITKPDDAKSVGEYYKDGRLYAVFDEPPGPNTGVDQEGTGLFGINGNNWLGWSAYIQTADPQPLEVEMFAPANRWYNLTESVIKNWSVQQKYTIVVYLRPPVTGGYITLTSLLCLRASGGQYQRIDLTPATWLTPVSSLPQAGTNRSWNFPIYASPGRYLHVCQTSGMSIRVWRYTSTGGYTFMGNLTSTVQSFVSNDYVTMQPNPDTAGLTSTFTIDIYPS